jgi:hypothetical protein
VNEQARRDAKFASLPLLRDMIYCPAGESFWDMFFNFQLKELPLQRKTY